MKKGTDKLKLEAFSAHCDLVTKLEIDKVALLAFYHSHWRNLEQFGLNDVSDWFDQLKLTQPNKSRLEKRILKSSAFVRGPKRGTFRLHAKKHAEFVKAFSAITNPPDEPKLLDGVLPKELAANTRGYIERLVAQINLSYDHSVFDGAAVLMRRLIEVLLVHAYEEHAIDSFIKDQSGQFKSLNKIISDAVSNPTLNLTKPVKACLDKFRKLGNFSAHSIHYNARRNDIEAVILEFRVSVEELLYKGGLKK